MALLTGYLPVEQGVACWAALRKEADALKASGDARTRGQIMADLLVERLTGQARAEDVNVEVGLVMPLDALLDPTVNQAAHLLGMGPLPAALARELLATSQGKVWWRRLFDPPRRPVRGGHRSVRDPHRRRFDGWLTKLVELRDQTCRDPYCDAPIRHIDHIRSFRKVDPGRSPTVVGCASGATTSARCPAGAST